MPVRSLVDLASATCIKNIRHLESVGDFLPYENVRHILVRVENARQLRRIELNSPHIEGRTGELWLKLIEKDFPIEFRAKAYKPQNPSKWYRVWEKYKGDHDRAIEESENNFRNALAGIQEEKAKNTSKIVESRLLPRKGRVGPRRAGHRDGSGSSLNFTGGSRTSTRTGASVMRKVRREVREIASIHGALSRPPSMALRQNRIQRAPQAMINDHRRAAQPAFKKNPKVPTAVTEHEARATFISDSDEGDSDDDRDDDGNGDGDQGDPLFGDAAKKKPAPRPPPKPAPKTTSKPVSRPTNSPARMAATSLLKSRPTAPASVRPIASSSTSRTPGSNARRLVTSGSSPAKPTGHPAPSSRRPPPDSKSPVKAPAREGELSSPSATSHPPPPQPPPREAGGEVRDPRPSAGSPPQARPPKRKAAGIFMKPNKRVH